MFSVAMERSVCVCVCDCGLPNPGEASRLVVGFVDDDESVVDRHPIIAE